MQERCKLLRSYAVLLADLPFCFERCPWCCIRSKEFLVVGFAMDPVTGLGPSPYLAPKLQHAQAQHIQQQQQQQQPLTAAPSSLLQESSGALAGGFAEGSAADAAGTAANAAPANKQRAELVVATAGTLLDDPPSAATASVAAASNVNAAGTTSHPAVWCSWLVYPPGSLPAKLCAVREIPGAPTGTPELNVELPEETDQPKKTMLNVWNDVAHTLEGPTDLVPYFEGCLEQQVG
jgi:hypothetical protein